MQVRFSDFALDLIQKTNDPNAGGGLALAALTGYPWDARQPEYAGKIRTWTSLHSNSPLIVPNDFPVDGFNVLIQQTKRIYQIRGWIHNSAIRDEHKDWVVFDAYQIPPEELQQDWGIFAAVCALKYGRAFKLTGPRDLEILGTKCKQNNS